MLKLLSIDVREGGSTLATSSHHRFSPYADSGRALWTIRVRAVHFPLFSAQLLQKHSLFSTPLSSLPRGTTIIGNTWGLHMDEERFPDPQEFKPERFKDFPLSAPEYAAMSGDDARDHWGYGYGRRICVGVSCNIICLSIKADLIILL